MKKHLLTVLAVFLFATASLSEESTKITLDHLSVVSLKNVKAKNLILEINYPNMSTHTPGEENKVDCVVMSATVPLESSSKERLGFEKLGYSLEINQELWTGESGYFEVSLPTKISRPSWDRPYVVKKLQKDDGNAYIGRLRIALASGLPIGPGLKNFSLGAERLDVVLMYVRNCEAMLGAR